jgi:hypothetical protein
MNERLDRRDNILGITAGEMHPIGAPIGAKIDLTTLAANAFAARVEGVRDHLITCFEFHYSRPDIIDDPAEFVAEDEGRNTPGAPVLESLEFAPADPTGGNLQADLARTGRRIGLFGDRQLLISRIE